jgi:hypothetical protein
MGHAGRQPECQTAALDNTPDAPSACVGTRARNEVKCDAGCTHITCVNTGTWGDGNAISSFVFLTVDGLTYIDQNGQPSSISTETWTATADKQPFV